MKLARAAALAGISGGLAACSAHPMGYLENTAGPAALPVERLGLGFVWIVSIVVAIIAALMVFAIRNARRAQAAHGDGVQRGERGLAWIYWGVGLSVPVLVAMAIWNFLVTRAIAAAPARSAITVEVTGHMWWWEIRYRASTPAQIITTANELVIPTGVPVRLWLTSADVIHDFWVPKLGPKMDMIPGQWNSTWMQADTAGVYVGHCAEFCGLEHAKMGLRVIALDPAHYGAWQRSMRLPAPADALPGNAVFLRACSSCHRVDGTQAGGIFGPDLSHFASRATLAAGVLANTRENRLRWISDPQRIKPGARMPNIPLSSADLDAVADYLGALK